jgi:phenylalanyl-tRNA synthetase alpha chain
MSDSVRSKAEGLSLSEKKILSALSKLMGKATLGQISASVNFKNPSELMNALNWLKAKGYVWIDEKVVRFYTLKGRKAGNKPLPERIALKLIANGPLDVAELSKHMDDHAAVSVSIGWLRRKNWAFVDESKKLHITDEGSKALDKPGQDELLLMRMEKEDVEEDADNERALRDLLSRRDFIKEHDRIVREVSLLQRGKQAISEGMTFDEEISLLSPELLKSGKWKNFRLRPYDLRAPVPVLSGSRSHPLLRTIRLVSSIFAEMGFTEIDDDYVQSTFWDMDALFTPQDHPARDMQDTFYLSNPAEMDLDSRLAPRVRSAHQNGGGTGSTGWGYRWNPDEAKKTLLRTHTTVATIKHLVRNTVPPIKAFAVGRIFRREAMDATHLSEFHQIEGVVMEKDASFDMLCGVLREFYTKIGFEKVRMRPGYFPYTEPSMEIDAFYNDKWIEMGGSGMFRPEVLRPLGIKYPVLAWGLGLERLVMIKYGFKDIRDLYVSDVSSLQKLPVV